jgi:hypothetical protein
MTVREQVEMIAAQVRTFIGTPLPDGYGNSVYVHHREDGAELVYEGRPGWAYEFQDHWAGSPELMSAAPDLDVEVGMNGYCLEATRDPREDGPDG